MRSRQPRPNYPMRREDPAVMATKARVALAETVTAHVPPTRRRSAPAPLANQPSTIQAPPSMAGATVPTIAMPTTVAPIIAILIESHTKVRPGILPAAMSTPICQARQLPSRRLAPTAPSISEELILAEQLQEAASARTMPWSMRKAAI